MRRPLALALGLLLSIAPNRIVDSVERLAFENPDDGRLRPWTLQAGRFKGVVFVWLLGRHPEHTSILKRPLSVLGLVMILVPRQALDVGLELAYENPDELEVKPWIRPVTRLIGSCFLVVGLRAVRAAGRNTEAASSTNA
ncbi:hypothetical protein [Natronorubrum texcoconense]|uniref:Uncharacterized protein n=1 Tax=Natronorubrum texcoconense TaxID=1095776 RepID=A0A1G9GB24_9EURY|nr:hypothetical protein [Natronorubrum texcoconense]SDK97856.1 hypothetical protein SAMN04515672_4426 [Natronorubrum texcoconense]